MIYIISEITATVSECFILYYFLITALGFRELSQKRIITSTICFIILTLINAFVWDNISHIIMVP